MKKYLLYMLNIMFILALVSCTSKDSESDKLTIAVSIAPQEAFVKAVAGDLVDVVTLIPAGASPTNYQPSPKEMTKFQNAQIYFTIGVPSEVSNILPNVAQNNKEIKIVYLDDVVASSYPARYFSAEADHEEGAVNEEDGDHDHEHEGRDPHIWLSPKRVIVMINEIEKQFIELDPSNKETYSSNAASFISELEDLDKNLSATISKLENKTFVIMHPSLGYFADDYGLEMIALEQNGKESTASHLQDVIDFSRENNIKVVFYQTEFDSSQAKTLASEINGEVLAIDTLSSDYMNNMNDILKLFTDVLN